MCSRNSKASLNAIQKRHFAKARANIHSAKSKQPTHSSHSDAPAWKSSHLFPKHDHRQRSLDEFEGTQNLARKLGSIRPRHPQLSPPRGNNDLRAGPRSHVSISSKVSSSSSASREAVGKSREANQHQSSDVDELEAYRRRLLGTKDWVGLECAMPPRMNFRSVKDRELIGKRRRLSQIPKGERDGLPPLKFRRTNYFEHMDRLSITSLDYVSQADVSVRIGSAVDRSVKSSYFSSGNATQVSLKGSDETLLDNELSLKQEAYTNPFLEPQHRFSDHSLPPSGHSAYTSNSDAESLESSPHRVAEMYKVSKFSDLQYHTSLSPSDSGIVREEDHSHISSSYELSSEALDTDIGRNEPLQTLDVAIEQREALRHRGDALKICNPVDHSVDVEVSSTDPYSDSLAGNSAPTLLRSLALQSPDQTFGSADSSSDASEGHGISECHRTDPTADKGSESSSNGHSAWAKNISMYVGEPIGILQGPLLQPDGVDESAYGREQISNDKVSNNVPAAEATQIENPQPNLDDEAIWRSFVFGDEDTKNEWTFDDPISMPEAAGYTASSTSSIVRAQPSIVAEVGTSPILQNPHLHVDITPSPSLINASALTADISTRAEADESQYQTSHHEDDDGGLANVLVNITPDAPIKDYTSPNTSSASHSGRPSPSSIKVNPSVPTSDSVSTSHSSSSLISSTGDSDALLRVTNHSAGANARAETRPARKGTRAYPTLLFKTPPKYSHVGGPSWGIEPVVLGRRVGECVTGKGKAISKGRNGQGKRRAKDFAEEDDIEDD